MRDGRFREDLYYRVNAFAIRLPSLRERQVDIPVLAQRFLARYCAAQGLPLDSKAFSREALDLLARAIRGRATSASSKAPCRARRCRRRAASIRAQDVEFLHAIVPPTASRRAIACRRSPKPSARTSCACSKRCSGTRRKRRACSTSAAARSTARSRNTASSRSRSRAWPRRAARPSSRQTLLDPVRARSGQTGPEQRQTGRADARAPAPGATRRHRSPTNSIQADGTISAAPSAIAGSRRLHQPQQRAARASHDCHAASIMRRGDHEADPRRCGRPRRARASCASISKASRSRISPARRSTSDRTGRSAGVPTRSPPRRKKRRATARSSCWSASTRTAAPARISISSRARSSTSRARSAASRFRPAPEERRFLFIAGGTGISPLRAMLHHALTVPHDEIGLLYSARTPIGICLREGAAQPGRQPARLSSSCA